MKKKFIGREQEWLTLKQISNMTESAIIVMYGRRRVGKTELLEQVFRTRNLLKFEGIESQPKQAQQHHVISQLADYARSSIIKDLKINKRI